MGGIVTEFKHICFFCGRIEEGEHHLIFGTSGRELSEEDGLKVPICNRCHNMGDVKCRIHDNPMAEKLSKMLGQALWERDYLLAEAIDSCDEDDRQKKSKEVRESFRRRYRKSYL